MVHGDEDMRQLPDQPYEAHWDFVNLHPCGLGVAVDHQTMDIPTDVASIFVTVDAGQHWSKRDAKPRLCLLTQPSWPVERFASVAVTSLGVIALAWKILGFWTAPGHMSFAHGIAANRGITIAWATPTRTWRWTRSARYLSKCRRSEFFAMPNR